MNRDFVAKCAHLLLEIADTLQNANRDVEVQNEVMSYFIGTPEDDQNPERLVEYYNALTAEYLKARDICDRCFDELKTLIVTERTVDVELRATKPTEVPK